MDEVVEIALDRLEPHPGNSNRMPAALFEKLVGHLQRTGRYPPVIVRPAVSLEARGGVTPGDPAEGTRDAMQPPDAGSSGFRGRFQILDGHHRVAALRRLGRSCARCVVWEVDDAEALVLLATLNRLEGRDDPKRRAALVSALAARRGVDALAAQLPEAAEKLRRYLALSGPIPPPAPPPPVDQTPTPVCFFLLPAERDRLEARLRAMGGTREAALMGLVDGDGRRGEVVGD